MRPAILRYSSALLRYLPVLFLLVWVPAVALAQMCHCHLCQMLGSMPIHSGPGTAAYGNLGAVAASPYVTSSPSASSMTGSASSTSTGAAQVVYLDFDSETGFGDDAYSAFERQKIQEEVEEDYELFDFEFTQTQPTSGDFTTVTMNADIPFFLFGIASELDFRNVDRNDTSLVNVTNFDGPTDQERTLLTSFLISHELGHTLGLRHVDGFGPIGSGINAASFAAGFDFPGPADADESLFHIMQTDSDNGFPNDAFFGERASVKLSFNERGAVVEESTVSKATMATAQSLALVPLDVPNPARVGDFVGTDFTVEALTVIGDLSSGSSDASTDVYSFEASAGDILNVEVISSLLNVNIDEINLLPGTFDSGEGRLTDSINPVVELLDADGNPVDYFGEPAINTLGPELFDTLLLDVLIPESGTYFLRITGGGETISEEGFTNTDGTPEDGDYELFLYTFGVDSGVRSTSAGDFNGDGTVDALDLVLFRESLGAEVTPGAGADGNANGIVDPEDYRYWLGNYGRVDAPASVPEPGAALLLASALLGLTPRRTGS